MQSGYKGTYMNCSRTRGRDFFFFAVVTFALSDQTPRTFVAFRPLARVICKASRSVSDMACNVSRS